MSGGEVGNSNQYVDTGLSYMTIRRQGGKEVTGQRQRRLATSLGGHHVMAGPRWLAAGRGRGHPSYYYR